MNLLRSSVKPASIRGVIQLWLVYVLGAALISSVAVTVKKGFGLFGGDDPAKAKIQAQALVDSDAKLQTALKDAADLRTKADAAAAAVEAQKKTRTDAGAEAVQEVIIALNQEENPSLNVVAAKSFAQSAAKSLDAVSEARIAVLSQQVKDLTSQNATVRATAAAALAAKDETIASGRKTEDALSAQAAAEKNARVAAEASATAIGTQQAALITEHAKTVESLRTAGERLASFGRWALWTAIILGVVLWVLPIVAKAHPELRWMTVFAKWCGKLVAYGLTILHEGEVKIEQTAHAGTSALLADAQAKLSAIKAA